MKKQTECRTIIPTIKIMVGPNVKKEDAIALTERLSQAYDDTYDDDDGLYAVLVKWLESAGVTGDFSLETPDVLLYDANKRPIQ